MSWAAAVVIIMGMSTEDTYEDATHEVDAGEPIEVGDLLDDPRTDVEALCLCALLWSATDTASDVSDLLCSTDFERGVYGELFEVITAQVRSGAPHDPASIAATLTQSGRTGGHRGARLTRALSSVTIAGAVPETVGHYAVAVLSAGYRRGFHLAARSMAAAAEQLPQDLLFEHLLSIGKAQRVATERLHHASTSLSPVRVSAIAQTLSPPPARGPPRHEGQRPQRRRAGRGPFARRVGHGHLRSRDSVACGAWGVAGASGGRPLRRTLR